MKPGAIRRFNGAHKKGCGARFSVLATYCWDPMRRPQNFWRAEDGREFELGNGTLLYVCPCATYCGVKRDAYLVRGTYRADKKCDARCESATGHDCECSCGGKNHGAAHAA